MQSQASKQDPLTFSKMAGGGNDFVVIDNRSGRIEDAAALTRRICTPHLSVGADGLILIENTARATFRMRYLKKAREHFDYIIIDGPALRSIVDGVIIAHKADGTVMVVSAQRSDTRAVQGALGKLRSFASPNLLGVVLNGVNPDASLPNDYYVRPRQLIALPETSSVG